MARAWVAAAVARTLVPIWSPAGDVAHAAAAIDAVTRRLAGDLTSAIACVIQLPVNVQCSTDADAEPSRAWRIRGEIVDAVAHDSTLELATPGVPLTAGNGTVEIIAAASGPGRPRTRLELEFHATAFEVPGSPPLLLAHPVRIPLGAHPCPRPLRELPGLPLIDRADGTQDRAESEPDLAQLWAFGVSIPWTFAPQDALAIGVRFDVPEPAGAGPSKTALAGGVFEALARFTFEWPQLALKLNTAQEPEAIDRVLALAATVTDGLRGWMPAPSDTAANGAGEAGWHYIAEWDRESCVLTLHGDSREPGSPVWPSIAGFSRQAAEPGAVSATYRPERNGGAPTLELTWGRLAARAVRLAVAEVRVLRNHAIAPAGMRLHPSLALSTHLRTTPVVLRPPLAVDHPIALPAAASLEASLAALIDALLAAPRGAHAAGDPAAVDAHIELAYRFAVAGDIRARLPVLFTTLRLSEETAAATARAIAARVREWRANAAPVDPAAQFVVAVSLFFLEPDAAPEPASRLAELTLAIDNRPEWWGDTPPAVSRS